MQNDIILDTKAESTWLNPETKSIQKLTDWVLTMLGAPLVTVELNKNQLDVCIQNAFEKYTKYAYFGPDKYLTYNLSAYTTGVGANLSGLNVSSVKDIAFGRDKILGLTNSDVFFGPQAWFMGNGGYPFFGSRGNFAGSFTTYHNLHEFFDLTKRMTGSNPDWDYDKTTKILRIMPEPKTAGVEMRGNYMLITCQCEPSIEELCGNEYVKRLSLAYAKQLLGTVRKKFSNITLLGGGTVDTTIGDEGNAELEKILEEIQKEESKGQSCYIC